MPRLFTSAVAIAAFGFALSGCSDLSRALGLEKTPPDEFAVVAASPLSLPPDYGLRPPHSLSGKPATPSPTAEARSSVFRLHEAPTQMAGAQGMLSPGQQVLLNRAGGVNVDPHIRETLDAEVNHQADASEGFIDSLLFWQDGKTETGEVVDPQSETKRLKAEGVTGKPTAERTDRSVGPSDR